MKILFVDDDPLILEAYKRGLRKKFEIETAAGGEQGLAMLSTGRFAAVVSDQHMPGMPGIEFLRRVREQHPDTTRIMLTGNADLNTSMDALNQGAIFRFLIKPAPFAALTEVLDQAVEQHRLVTSEKELLEKTLRGAIRAIVEIFAAINPELFGRAVRIKEQMRIMVEALGFDYAWSHDLAALMSQAGLVTLPTDVVRRADKGLGVTSGEQAMLDNAPETTFKLLQGIPRLEPVAAAIRYQQANFDGSGAQEGWPVGQDIPLAARILKVLLDYEKLIRSGVSPQGSVMMMKGGAARYDPQVLDAFVRTIGHAGKEPRAVPTVQIWFGQLRVGDMLASNVETSDGKLLIAGGNRVTETLFERIANHREAVGIREPLMIEQRTAKAA